MHIIAVISFLLSFFFTITDLSDTGASSPVSDCSLPAWFLPSNGFIGVSDPKLDSADGYNQAVARALLMYSVSNNISISTVYELYYHVENNSVSIDNVKSRFLSEFKSEVANYSYEVTNYYVTKYNETIVDVVVFEDAKADNQISTDASLMLSFDSNKGHSSFGEQIMLNSVYKSDSTIEASWKSIFINGSCKKTSSLGGKNLEIQKPYSYYEDYGNGDSDDYVFSDLKNGLWNAYVDLFFQALSNFRCNDVIIKVTGRNISEAYNESYNEKSQRIARMAFCTEANAKINNIILKNNVLYAKWDFADIKGNENKNIIGAKRYTYNGYGHQPIVYEEESKAKNEAYRAASLHADSELSIIAYSSVNKNMDNYRLNEGSLIKDTVTISSYSRFNTIQILKEKKPVRKNNAYICEIEKEITLE